MPTFFSEKVSNLTRFFEKREFHFSWLVVNLSSSTKATFSSSPNHETTSVLYRNTIFLLAIYHKRDNLLKYSLLRSWMTLNWILLCGLLPEKGRKKLIKKIRAGFRFAWCHVIKPDGSVSAGFIRNLKTPHTCFILLMQGN